MHHPEKEVRERGKKKRFRMEAGLSAQFKQSPSQNISSDSDEIQFHIPGQQSPEEINVKPAMSKKISSRLFHGGLCVRIGRELHMKEAKAEVKARTKGTMSDCETYFGRLYSYPIRMLNARWILDESRIKFVKNTFRSPSAWTLGISDWDI
ncbi:hypothetical protein NPIL_42241 [Nephila pilipes]|uniref:Uncharacterized protein n=1 Tax=Nephila pilipes TaxID=299642 RepID=A0A8X6PGN2_NEPPI|nr:hypothetical protein NPIL_42241 [Nephila pilipes]